MEWIPSTCAGYARYTYTHSSSPQTKLTNKIFMLPLNLLMHNELKTKHVNSATTLPTMFGTTRMKPVDILAITNTIQVRTGWPTERRRFALLLCSLGGVVFAHYICVQHSALIQKNRIFHFVFFFTILFFLLLFEPVQMTKWTAFICTCVADVQFRYRRCTSRMAIVSMVHTVDRRKRRRSNNNNERSMAIGQLKAVCNQR